MNDGPYRAALIGLGRIADTIDDETVGSGWLEPFSHMGSYMDVPEVLVVGAADRFPEQRAAFGQRWGVPEEKLYESYQEMLERERPDIVSICTHVAPRAEITLDIVRMVREGRTGVKCIWVEKPMAVSLQEADSMVEACRDAGVVLMLNAMRASDVYYRRARSLIDEGALGRMLQITAHGSGPLAHMGVHWLGAMCVLAGGSERVSWLVGEAESDEKANSGGDLAGNAYLAFEKRRPGFLPDAAQAARPPGRSTPSARRVRSPFATATPATSSSFGGWGRSSRAPDRPRCGTSSRDRSASGARVSGRSRTPSTASSRARRPTARATWGDTCWKSRLRFASRTASGTSGSTCRSPTGAWRCVECGTIRQARSGVPTGLSPRTSSPGSPGARASENGGRSPRLRPSRTASTAH